MSIHVKYIETETWHKLPFDTSFKPYSWFSPYWRAWLDKEV